MRRCACALFCSLGHSDGDRTHLLSTFGPVAGTFSRRRFRSETKSPKADFGGQHGQTMSAKSGNPLTTVLVAVAIVAALYFGREVLLPMALAVLLSFVLAPPVRLLQRLYLPRFAAVTIVVLLAFGVIFATWYPDVYSNQPIGRGFAALSVESW